MDQTEQLVQKANNRETITGSSLDRMKEDGESVSIVMPVFNEETSLSPLLAGIDESMAASGLRWEAIVVDDGSTDGTSVVLRQLKTIYPNWLQVITHPYNQGNGSAIKTGIRAARGTIIACMDADAQHNPQDLLKLLPYATEYELVVGARTENYMGVWNRNLGNWLLNNFASWVARFPIKDLTSGYRVFRASAIRRYADVLPARFSYPTTSTLIFIKVGYRLKYLPISVQPRANGASKIRVLRDGWRFLLVILKVLILFEPLRVFAPIALLSFGLAFASTLLAFSILRFPHIPNSAVVLFVLGVFVLLLGLVAEQIAMLMTFVRSDSRSRQDDGD